MIENETIKHDGVSKETPSISPLILPLWRVFTDPGRLATAEIIDQSIGPVPFSIIRHGLTEQVKEGLIDVRNTRKGYISITTIIGYLRDLAIVDAITKDSRNAYRMTGIGRLALDQLRSVSSGPLLDAVIAKRLEDASAGIKDIVTRDPRLAPTIRKMIEELIEQRVKK